MLGTLRARGSLRAFSDASQERPAQAGRRTTSSPGARAHRRAVVRSTASGICPRRRTSPTNGVVAPGATDGRRVGRSRRSVRTGAPCALWMTHRACLAGHTTANWACGKEAGLASRVLLDPGIMRRALLLLLTSTPAFADHELVRDDIVDLRHDRWPNRRVFLGWTADSRAVIHVASCGTLDGSGSPFCSSTLEVFGATNRSGTPLLDPTCKQCDPDRANAGSQGPMWAVSTELASRAIHAEREALDALGTLRPSAVRTPPAVKIVGEACRIDVLVGQRRITGVMKVSPMQCVTNGGDSSFRTARIRDVQLSPDRRRLAVTLTVEPRTFEWGDPVDITMVVDAT